MDLKKKKIINIKNMNIIKKRNLFVIISVSLMILSLLSIFIFGFKYSVELAGGTLIEFSENTAGNTKIEKIKDILKDEGYDAFKVQQKGSGSFVIKTKDFTEEKANKLIKTIEEKTSSDFTLDIFKNIGPTVSSEIKSKSLVAILFVILLIIGFIAYVFKGVSKPVFSSKYGLVAIIALAHDVLIPAGLFAFFGHIFAGFEINVLFITAVLAILGFSVNDTIVVFDRIRENLKKESEKKKFEEKDIMGENFKKIVDESLNQTIKRSILTSLTTLVVLGALYFVGGETTREFSLVLIVGLIAGTYSSIFFASPLLVILEQFQDEEKIKAKKEKKQKELEEEYPYSNHLDYLDDSK